MIPSLQHIKDKGEDKVQSKLVLQTWHAICDNTDAQVRYIYLEDCHNTSE